MAWDTSKAEIFRPRRELATSTFLAQNHRAAAVWCQAVRRSGATIGECMNPRYRAYQESTPNSVSDSTGSLVVFRRNRRAPRLLSDPARTGGSAFWERR